MKKIILVLIFSSLLFVIAVGILVQKDYEPSALMKLRENDSGVIVREPYTGTLNLSLKIDVSKPFTLKKEIINFSDVTKEFLITDMLNDIFK